MGGACRDTNNYLPPPSSCGQSFAATRDEAASGVAAVAHKAFIPGSVSCEVKRGSQRIVAEMGHVALAPKGFARRAQIGTIAGCHLFKRDGNGLHAVGASRPRTAADFGVNQYGRGAAIVIQRRANLFDAPEVGQGDVGAGTAFARPATVATGA